jgi:hypothetical protein
MLENDPLPQVFELVNDADWSVFYEDFAFQAAAPAPMPKFDVQAYRSCPLPAVESRLEAMGFRYPLQLEVLQIIGWDLVSRSDCPIASSSSASFPSPPGSPRSQTTTRSDRLK